MSSDARPSTVGPSASQVARITYNAQAEYEMGFVFALNSQSDREMRREDWYGYARGAARGRAVCRRAVCRSTKGERWSKQLGGDEVGPVGA